MNRGPRSCDERVNFLRALLKHSGSAYSIEQRARCAAILARGGSVRAGSVSESRAARMPAGAWDTRVNSEYK